MSRSWQTSLWRAVVALMALTLAACAVPTEFTTPIEDPGSRTIDPRLLGTWYGVARCRFVSTGQFTTSCAVAGSRPALLIVLHVSSEQGATALTIRETAVALDLADLVEGIRRRGERRVIQFEVVAYPALIDGVSYYSLRRRAGFGYDYTGTGEQPHYIVAQLEVDEQDSLRYRLLSHEERFSQEQTKAQGLREAVVSKDGKDLFSYPIAEYTRERLLAFLRERHYPTIDGLTYGPFRRMTRDFDAAKFDTLACAPDRDRRYLRFAALADVSVGFAQQDLPTEALTSVALALAAARAGVREGSTMFHLTRVAEVQGMSGDIDGARTTLKQVTDYRDRAANSSTRDAGEMKALANWVFLATAWAGNIAEALRLADSLPDASPSARAWALGSIAEVQAQQGDWAGAMQTARRAGRLDALLGVANRSALRGDQARARATLSEAAALASGNVGELVAVAEAQRKRSLHEDGAKTAQIAAALLLERRNDPLVHERIRLAKLQVEMKDPESARRTLAPIQRLLEEESIGISALYGEAAKLIALESHLGDQAAARYIQQRSLADLREREAKLGAASASDRVERHHLQTAMAQAYAAVGDLEEAIALAQSLGNFRANALYDIVKILGYVEPDPSRSAKTLQLAYDSARAVHAEAGGASSYDLVVMAGNHKRAGDDGRARSLYREAAQTAAGASSRRYQGTDGIKVRVSDLLWTALHQHKDGLTTDARESGLKALDLARSMPPLSPCDSDELLGRLALPRFDGHAD